ncbi:MAG: hypothetical protein F2663_04805 [Actinobacteria bacterium]|uniref:Unannotated protein n=1 Tax=freshwater metagenome TaxID=449393 RepID=A0A6J6PEC7_9ZZZZ|nr:hypothetical protein [Actinomycetota bacterium]
MRTFAFLSVALVAATAALTGARANAAAPACYETVGGHKLAIVCPSPIKTTKAKTICSKKSGATYSPITCPNPIVTKAQAAEAARAAKTPGQTKGNPYPLGSPGYTSASGWKLTVTHVNFDAWASVVQGASPSNAAPPAGYVDVLVTVNGVYVGDQGANGSELADAMMTIGQKGVTYLITGSKNCGTIPNNLEQIGDIYGTTPVSGNLCYQVATSDVASLVLYWNQNGANGPWWALH